MKTLRSWWKALRNYFKARPWLRMWTAIIIAALSILAATGQIHTQGNGFPTVYELSSVMAAIGVWVIAKYFFKTDLMEEYLMGWIFGIQWEFLTEPYWTYLPDKFNVLVWRGKDIPLLALCGWGTTLTIALILSDWFGKLIFRIRPRILHLDWRVLLCDALAIQIMGSLAEWSYGILLHCWDYNLGFGIGKSPLGLGWEIHIGYMIIMFWYGTTMRVWKAKLEGEL